MTHSAIFLDRRAALRALLALSVGTTLNACQRENPPFAVGLNSFVPYRFLNIAQNEGLFGRNDIRLLEFESASHTVQSLASGLIDAGLLTLDEVLRLWHRGYAIDVVAVLDFSAGVDQVLARPPIKGLKDIRRKKIAVEVGAVGSIVLSKLLERAELDTIDVDIVYGVLSDHVRLYKEGQVDLVISFAPESSQIKRLGAETIFSSADFSPMIIDVMVVSHDRAQANPEAVRALVDAYLDIQQRWKTASETLTAQLVSLSKLTPEELNAVFDGVNLTDRTANKQLLNRTTLDLQNAVNQLSQVLKLPSLDISSFLVDEYL